MNIKELNEMVNLMNENNLTELEIEKDGMRIRLKKESGEIKKELLLPGTKAIEVPPPPPGGETEKEPENLIEIKSPMVGTFYRAPSPESTPYIEEGSVITVGQAICIIEAMKLMNEIKSEVEGRIKKILVKNGDPVEFGQTLVYVEPK
jgi:acetyl-CoA carboxylase biotin carboxyl carrier protein